MKNKIKENVQNTQIEESKVIRCTVCRGSKEINGFGGIRDKCWHCKGEGTMKIKSGDAVQALTAAANMSDKMMRGDLLPTSGNVMCNGSVIDVEKLREGMGHFQVPTLAEISQPKSFGGL